MPVGECGGREETDVGDSWRGDCWDGLHRPPTELRRTAGEGAAEGCLKSSFPTEAQTPPPPGGASSRGGPAGVLPNQAAVRQLLLPSYLSLLYAPVL